MAKDTEKLIRQLSLISYLMAERRPVTALEIRRDVEGYSGMNEDAFARRFYADRAELDSLGIQLTVEKPIDGVAEQENYSLRPENFHLPAIEFTDGELAALQTALSLLDGEFAYAEPLRLALQQISWGRPSPLRAPDQRSVALGLTASAGGHELSQRLAKIETAIFRNKTVLFDYYTMERDETGPRKVDPYHLLYQGGQFYLLGHSHERGELRVFRLSRIQGKVAYASKAEHDFKRPADFDPRPFANRADWQFGDPVDTAEIHVSERIGWQVERHYGRYGEIEHEDDGAAGAHAPAGSDGGAATGGGGRRETAIRPERFARLVTLASILIEAGREGRRAAVAELLEQMQLSEGELREDVNVLNVVNFGGGSYVLYAEFTDDGFIDVDPEPYSDNFARPARLLPVEAKALVAAIDLIGEHIPEGSLASAREKIVAALGEDPSESGLQIAAAGADDSEIAAVISRAIARSRVVELDYYRPDKDEFSQRRMEPYQLVHGREGWYVASFDLERNALRHFRLDRIREARVTEDARVARVWISPERARWAREERRVTEELADGSVIVDLRFAGNDYLAREILKEAGDAAVLEPEEAREAVRAAVAKLAPVAH